MQSLRNLEYLVFWLMLSLSFVTSLVAIVTGVTLMVVACCSEEYEKELISRFSDFFLLAILAGLTARAFWRGDRWKP